ncbi:hypothetical protein HYS03_02440 [Candidatus Woesebacteria bacterium]|nr:hypothetical protein [Candidatus Woesebacteria bacterium]QQG47135.1 MAG: hypothetical protein HY044_03255 [Candidatus Woesebacteria bacterium]
MNKKIIYFLEFGIIVIIVTIFLKKFLIVKKIRCISDISCSITLTQKLQKAQNLPLFTSKSTVLDILKKEVTVKNYSMRIKPPDSLEVYIIERKESAGFAANGKFVYVDDEDVVIKFSDKKDNVPQINIYDGKNYKFRIGDKLPENLVFASALSRDLSNLYAIKEITLGKTDISANFPNLKVFFPTKDDEDLLIGRLKFVLSWLNNSFLPSKMKTLDLRFKNPVVRSENG